MLRIKIFKCIYNRNIVQSLIITGYAKVKIMNLFCRTCVEFSHKKQKGSQRKTLRALIFMVGRQGVEPGTY